jgi:glycosyltransferase involved in cell wall biosynthesis
MKRLIIFNPSIEDGGVEKNLYLIANYLADKISKITLVTSSVSKKKLFSKKIKFSSSYFNHFDNFGRLSKYFFCIIILVYNIIKYNRNVLIFSFQANIYAIIIAKLFNIKIVTRSNTSPLGWTKNNIKQKIFKFFFKKADLIIVNSFEFKKQMDRLYNIKTKVILNPFNFGLIMNQSKKKLKDNFFKKNYLKLISVGRLVDQKDHMTILKALNIVLKKKKNIQLIIIGKGEKKDNLNNYIIDNHLDFHVKLIGYKNNPFNYINSADIFILSSKFEGSPNVLIESLFLKKRVISTDCPTGPREILANGKYGSLFKVGDYKKLSSLILNFNNYKKNNNISHFINSKYSHKQNCYKYYKTLVSFLS